MDYRHEPIHLGNYSERRRTVVTSCDQDRVVDHHYTTDAPEHVTCQTCLALVREGDEALQAMRRIVDAARRDRRDAPPTTGPRA